MEHHINRLCPITLRRFRLFENIIVPRLVRKIEGTSFPVLLTAQEQGRAVFSGHKGGQRLCPIHLFDIEGIFPLHIAVGIKAFHRIGGIAVRYLLCGVEFKCDPLHRRTVLVHLFDLLVQLGLKVKPHRQAGVIVAPLQIEHFQGMVGIAGKGIAVPGCCTSLPGIRKHPFQRSCLNAVCPQCLYVHSTIRFIGETVGLPALPHHHFTG